MCVVYLGTSHSPSLELLQPRAVRHMAVLAVLNITIIVTTNIFTTSVIASAAVTVVEVRGE